MRAGTGAWVTGAGVEAAGVVVIPDPFLGAGGVPLPPARDPNDCGAGVSVGLGFEPNPRAHPMTPSIIPWRGFCTAAGTGIVRSLANPPPPPGMVSTGGAFVGVCAMVDLATGGMINGRRVLGEAGCVTTTRGGAVGV